MNLSVSFEGRNYEVERYTSVEELMKLAKYEVSPDYNDNPPVGAFVNGEARPLSYRFCSSSSVVPVRVFDPMGRRIYRHSLSFLLFYAAKLVFPDRRLVIGHSLGSSFYFRFDDGSRDIDADVCVIEKKMRELVSMKLSIEFCSVPFKEAINFFSINGNRTTVMLLACINTPDVNVYKTGDYCDIAYEPIVSNTSVLSLWKLAPYGSDGMILQYPVSSAITEIKPFKDNPLLFSVFEENKQWGKILGVRCVGEMNEVVFQNRAKQFVRHAEALHRRKLAQVADSVFERDAHAVFIAGPSSSGKTTFAKRLCEQLALLGKHTIRISLDDYYLPRKVLPKNAKGEPDYECLEALRVEQFRKNMKDIFDGKQVCLPKWSFSKQEQSFPDPPVSFTENTVFVIEGIHGLNPQITSCVNPKYVFKVYISALTQLNLDDHNRVSTTDNRLIRRIVRDLRERGASVVDTLSMWDDVTAAESKNIFIHQNNADVMVNSALDYELGVLAPYASPVLKSVSAETGRVYATARRLLAFLENVYEVPAELVPADSALREFIGQSDYSD